ncbi:hypothetical protein ACFUV1_28365 [Streptomyces griseoincarnatus]
MTYCRPRPGPPTRSTTWTTSGVLAGVAGLLLVVLGCVRARVHDDRAGAVVLGLLPNMGVAGSGLLSLSEGQGGGQGIGSCSFISPVRPCWWPR